MNGNKTDKTVTDHDNAIYRLVNAAKCVCFDWHNRNGRIPYIAIRELERALGLIAEEKREEATKEAIDFAALDPRTTPCCTHLVKGGGFVPADYGMEAWGRILHAGKADAFETWCRDGLADEGVTNPDFFRDTINDWLRFDHDLILRQLDLKPIDSVEALCMFDVADKYLTDCVDASLDPSLDDFKADPSDASLTVSYAVKGGKSIEKRIGTGEIAAMYDRVDIEPKRDDEGNVIGWEVW